VLNYKREGNQNLDFTQNREGPKIVNNGIVIRFVGFYQTY